MLPQFYTSSLTVNDLLTKDQYIIPIYQRNFAWDATNIEQLLKDIYENNNQNYYIGTLIVAVSQIANKTCYEVIDGQQRLTALNIIYSKLVQSSSKAELNLSFECREKSTFALKQLRLNKTLGDYAEGSFSKMQEATKCIEQFEKTYLGDNTENIEKYINKFLDVKIFRIALNDQTDKNHYFEVMNNRGEQLESHEIVKAKLMDSLKDNPRGCDAFSAIWDACSNMNSRFEKNDKVKRLWGEKFTEDPLTIKTFDDLCSKLDSCKDQNKNKSDYTIFDLENYPLQGNPQDDSKQDDDKDEYTSVIDFQNFLLQVLELGGFKKNVKLDASKFLLEEFGCIGEGSIPDAKKFIITLLKFRILFDKFIIKRRKTDKTARGWKWVIERPKMRDGGLGVINTFNDQDSNTDDAEEGVTDSKRMCMLQAMFFTTFRRDAYMRWLSKALANVYADNTGLTLLKTLEDYSIDFIKDSRTADGVHQDELTKGLSIHRYVFNFLDYQLWLLYRNHLNNNDNPRYESIISMLDRDYVRNGFKNFIFTRRNSIEHYLAQEKGTHEGISSDIINNFGNLALIGKNLNSRLSNRMCQEKKDYHDNNNPPSLKYVLMLSESEWNSGSILHHGELYLELLNDKTNNYFKA